MLVSDKTSDTSTTRQLSSRSARASCLSISESCPVESGQLEFRLAFDDRAVIGKRMASLDQQRGVARLQVDVADRAHRNAGAGVENVQHAFGTFLRDELLLHCPEDFRIGGI